MLVTNFNREGLDHEEMETLLHEFGHVLHGVLSKTDYVSHAGTSVKQRLRRGAVADVRGVGARASSRWRSSSRSAPSARSSPRDEIERSCEAARRFGQGIRYARQWLYATFDMALSTEPRPPLAVWKEHRGRDAAGLRRGHDVPGLLRAHRRRTTPRATTATCGREVIALDMLSAFKGNLLDPAVGPRYRDTILAQGGQEEEMVLVRRFLGRDPSSDAFFAEITGKR